MYQFFVEDEQIANDLVIIEGSDVNHIRNVLRMKCGEKVRISSTSGRNFFGTIDRIAENVVEVCITEETALDTELPCRICLFQGLPGLPILNLRLSIPAFPITDSLNCPVLLVHHPA